MSKYLVRVFAKTGESISFITPEIKETPFPDLEFGEFLYFHYSDHQNILDLILEHAHYSYWHRHAVQRLKEANLIQNFTVRAVPEQAPEYDGLTRSEAQERALDRDLSFRVVFEDGNSVAVEDDYKPNRINVYLDQNIVYKAEIF